MAIWYEVEKNKEGIKNFLDSNCGFHDYRIDRIEYVASKDYCDVYLSYCKTEGTVIRFVGLFDIHIHGDIDYEADWMFGSELFIQDNGRYIYGSMMRIMEIILVILMIINRMQLGLKQIVFSLR